MKKTIFLSLLLITNIFANAQINTFEKYISGFGSYEITDILEHNQQFYLLCNLSYDTFDQKSSFLLKINKEGDSVLYYGIDISFHYVLRAFTKNLSGGLCFIGGIDSLESNFNLRRDGLFINTDFEGNLNTSKSYQFSSKSEYNNIIIDDTSYFVTGNKFVSNNNIDILCVKIDSNGILKDSLTLDFRSLDAVTSLSLSTNNILISGTILGGFNDGYISLLTNELDTLFFKKFYLSYDNLNRPIKLWYSYSSKFASNNTILFPCVFFVYNPNNPNDLTVFEHTGLIRTDKNGNLIDQKIYYLNCRNDRPMDIFESNDGNYIIAGTINFAPLRPIPQSLNGDFYLMKVDTSGNILWFKQYGNSNYQELKSVIKTSDGGFLLSGYSITNYTNQERTGFIVKTDANGNVSTGIGDKKIQELNIFPNPVTNALYINSTITITTYRITDLLGNVISKGEVSGNSIDIGVLFPGLYVIEAIDSKGSIYRNKFVKN